MAVGSGGISHKLSVQLSMQEADFAAGIGTATTALVAFQKALRKLEVDAKVTSTSVTSSISKTSAAAQTAAAASTKAAAATKAASAAASAATNTSLTGWQKLSIIATKNKVAWNQTANRMAIAGGIMVGVFAAVSIGYANFQKAMSDATAVIDVNIYQMQALSNAALDMGRTTLYSASEAAQAIEALAKAGVSAADIYGGALTGAVNLAGAGGLSLGEAAETAAIMMIQFGKSGQDVVHIADLLSAAAGKAVGDVHDLVMALKQGGLVASQFGLSIEDTATTLAIFAQNGLIGSDAGTSLKIMLQRLAAPASRAQKEMAKLGIDVWDANGAFIGMEKFVGQMNARLNGLTQEERNHALAVIFGTDAMRSAAIVLKTGSEQYRKWYDAVNDAGFAAEVMQKRMDNLAGDTKRLAGAWDALVASAGQGANSSLRGMTQQLTGLVNTLGRMDQKELNNIVQLVLAFGGVALTTAAFMKLVIGITEFNKAIGGANKLFPSFLAKVKAAPGIFAAFTLAIGAFVVGQNIANENMQQFVGTLDEMEQRIIGIVRDGNLDSLQQKFDELFNHSPWIATNNSGAAFTKQTRDLGDALKYLHGTVKDDWFAQAGNMFATNPLFNPDIAKSVEFFKQYDAGLSALVSSGDLQTATAGARDLVTQMEAQQFTAEEIKKSLPLAFSAMVAYAKQLGVDNLSTEDYINMLKGDFPPAIAIAIDEQNQLNGTFEKTGNAAIDAATKTRQAVNQMVEDMTDGIKRLQGKADWESALDSLKVFLKDLKGTTAAAKQARKEIRNINKGGTLDDLFKNPTGRSIFGSAKSIREAGVNALQNDIANGLTDPGVIEARFAKIRRTIIKFGVDAGVSRDIMVDLVDQMNLVPENITTTFSSPGLVVNKKEAKELKEALKTWPGAATTEILLKNQRPSKAEVDAFIEGLDDIPPEVEATIRTVAEFGGLEAVKRALSELEDEDVWIRTFLNNKGIVQWNNYNPKNKQAYIDTYVRYHNNSRQGGPKLAGGGQVPGWSPTKTADNIPAALTAGEYVQPVDTVQYYGLDFMDKLRRRLIPKQNVQHFAEGGEARPTRVQYVQAPTRVVETSTTNMPAQMIDYHPITYYPIAENTSRVRNRDLQTAAALGRFTR